MDDEARIWYESENRLENLEKNIKQSENFMDLRLLRWKNQIEEGEKQLEILKNELNEMHQDFKIEVNSILMLIEQFTDCESRDQFEKLGRKVKHFGFEDKVTKEHFIRIVNLELAK